MPDYPLRALSFIQMTRLTNFCPQNLIFHNQTVTKAITYDERSKLKRDARQVIQIQLRFHKSCGPNVSQLLAPRLRGL